MSMSQIHKLSIIADFKGYCDILQPQSAEPNSVLLLKYSVTKEITFHTDTSDKINQKSCKLIFIPKPKFFNSFKQTQSNAS